MQRRGRTEALWQYRKAKEWREKIKKKKRMAEPIAWASEEERALSVEMPNKKQDVSYTGISDRTTIFFFSVSMSHIFHEINLSWKITCGWSRLPVYLGILFLWGHFLLYLSICFSQSGCPSSNSADPRSSCRHLLLALNTHLTWMLGGVREKMCGKGFASSKEL